jgi:hypothetical protein
MKDSSLEEWFLLHGWIDANSSFVCSSDSQRVIEHTSWLINKAFSYL